MLHFTMLSGDVNWKEYGGKFVSKKLNNGDFDYWLVIDVINMWDATEDEKQKKYVIEIHAVSPQAAGKENLDQAIGSCGWSDDQIDNMTELMQVETLDDYGIFAMLKSFSGNNIAKLMKEVRKECDLIECLFGFYMDRPENRIGSNGWDCIAGNITAGLYR